MKHLFLAILLLLPVTAFCQHGHAPAKEAAPVALTAGLGDINHPVSTNNRRGAKVFQPGTRVSLRLQPRRSHALFQTGRATRSTTRDGLLGHRRSHSDRITTCRPKVRHLSRLTRNLQKAIASSAKSVRTRARLHRSALSKRYSSDLQADQTEARRRLQERDGRTRETLSRRPGRGHALRRKHDEPATVETLDARRQTGA